MRIVIDLQAAQSKSSKNRGIGRYALSLSKAILRNPAGNEILIALNGSFPESINAIRGSFEGLIPQSQIVVWPGIPGVNSGNTSCNSLRQASEILRESFISNLKPDMVLVSSLFEGLDEDIVTSIGALPNRYKTAVILYDLIPLIHRSHYLENRVVATWYEEKLAQLKRADLLLSISGSSRQEAIDHLSFDANHTINISSDADSCFRHLTLPEDERRAIQTRYGLTRPFVMYTGGIDYRKNIEGLIRSFSRLPENLRDEYQLAIVCAVSQEKRRELYRVVTDCGLKQRNVVMTGFVPESDLVALYNLCSLFVFPSLHEGFGLPALEAMRCGAPVIASNTSSLPEVIGHEAALFDPHSETDITEAIRRALSDQVFRSELIAQSAQQARCFSWDASAKTALSAMRHIVEVSPSKPLPISTKRPKLAFVSPLPPERSGIADYSAELLPALNNHYEIDVIVDQAAISSPWIGEHCEVRSFEWFYKNAGSFDRILYHFGNSAFHQNMFDMLKAHPGVVVLHDFFLSGVVAYMDFQNLKPGFLSRQIFLSHGYKGLIERCKSLHVEDVIFKYPCNFDVIQDSLGLIVHSLNSVSLGSEWYDMNTKDWEVVPLLRDSNTKGNKLLAREKLGIKNDDFVVCSFGMLGPTKLNTRLVNAWINSSCAHDPCCHLIFVGENSHDEYGRELISQIKSHPSGDRIVITGWVDGPTYRDYLSAADVGVQLRSLSRGETSATVLDCMNHQLATIANANGSMADLDPEALWLLDDNFSDKALTDALNTLWHDAGLRESYGSRGRELIVTSHNPVLCADQYAIAIERFYAEAGITPQKIIPAIGKLTGSRLRDTDFVHLADAMDRGFPAKYQQKQLLIDVTPLLADPVFLSAKPTSGLKDLLRQFLTSPPSGYRVDLVYTESGAGYKYAHQVALRLLDCPVTALDDDILEYHAGDVIIQQHAPLMANHSLPAIQSLRAFGVHVILIDESLQDFLAQLSDWTLILPRVS